MTAVMYVSLEWHVTPVLLIKMIKMPTMSVYVPEEIYNALVDASRRDGKKPSALAQAIIREWAIKEGAKHE